MSLYHFLLAALLVVLDVHHLLSAHGADALLVAALLAVVRAQLVHLGAADLALFELLRVRVEAALRYKRFHIIELNLFFLVPLEMSQNYNLGCNLLMI